MEARVHNVSPPISVRRNADNLLSPLYEIVYQPCEPYEERLSDACLLQKLHQAIEFALNDSDVRVKNCYAQVWSTIKSKLLGISKEVIIDHVKRSVTVEEVETSFNNLLQTTLKSHKEISVKEINFLSALINFFRNLAIQCLVLHRLTNLDLRYHDLQRKNYLLNYEVTDKLRGVTNAPRLQENLIKSLKLAASEIKWNHYLENWTRWVSKDVENFCLEEVQDYKNVKETYLKLVKDIENFNSDLNQNTHRIQEEKKFAVNVLENVNLATLQAEINKIALEIKAFHLENIPNRINESARLLEQYKKLAHDKKLAWLACVDQLKQRYEHLKERNNLLHDKKNGFLAQISETMSRIKKINESKVIRAIPVVVFDEHPRLKELKEAQTSLSKCLNLLYNIQNNYVKQKANVDTYIAKLDKHAILKTHLLFTGIFKSVPLNKAALGLEQSGRVFLTEIHKQRKRAWDKVVKLVEFIKDQAPSLIKVQKTLSDQIVLAEYEVNLLKSQLLDELQNLQNSNLETIKKIELYQVSLEQSHQFEKKHTQQASAEAKKIQDLGLTKIRQAKADLEIEYQALYQLAENFRPNLNKPDIPIELDNQDHIKSMEKQIENLQQAYQSQLRKKDLTSKKLRVTRVPTLNQPSESGFFQKHWGKITATTLSFGAAGLSVGLSLGLVGALPSLGLSTIVLSAIGFGAGTVIGALAGVGIAFARNGKDKPLQLSTTLVQQQLNPQGLTIETPQPTEKPTLSVVLQMNQKEETEPDEPKQEVYLYRSRPH